MSLTALLRVPEVKDIFTRNCRVPALEPRLLLISPRHTNYMLVGTAADYAIRWVIAGWNVGRVSDQPWVAHQAYNLCRATFGPTDSRNVLLGKGLTRCQQLHREHADTGVFTPSMARACIFLAQMDIGYREGPSRIDFKTLTAVLPEETKDVLHLALAIPREKFTAKTSVALNPSFGRFSEAVGGADADIILDDMLIDIKTSKYHDLKRDYIHQLVGYRILFPGFDPNVEIRRGAIYFSRHADLVEIPFDTIIPPTNFKHLTAWLTDFAGLPEYHAPGSEEAEIEEASCSE